MTNEDILVYVIWTVTGVLATWSIRSALRAGLNNANKPALLFWRRVKLGSAVLGVVGLGPLLLSLDQLVRDSTRVQSREYSMDRFYEAKFLLAHQLAVTCGRDSRDAQEGCKDLQNIDNGFNMITVRDGVQLSPVTTWQRRPAVEPIAERLNSLVADINRTSPAGVDRSLLSVERRIQVAWFAAMLVTLAIAGSVGEAAFQLRQAKADHSR